MRLRKFRKTVPAKLYLLLAAIVVFSFFSNDFMLVDIRKTAIILAAGIDREEDSFKVTAQIAVPKGSDRTAGGTSSVEIDGEGETVSACFSQIYSKTGRVPKLVFCDLLVLGEEACKEDVMGCLDYFLRNEYMSDSCRLAACEGDAGDLLSSQNAIDDVSSLALQNLFSDAAEKSGRVVTTSLKEFAIGYYGVSKSGYMPYLRKQEEEGGKTAEDEAGGGSSGGTQSEGDTPVVYSAGETAIFSEGKEVAVLSSEETFAFALLKGKVFSGALTSEEKGKKVSLNILSNDGGVKLDVKKTPRAQLSVRLKVRLQSRSEAAPIEDVTQSILSEEGAKNAADMIERRLASLFSTCKEGGCDLLRLNRMLYRSSLQTFRAWNGNILPAVEAEIRAEVQSVK